MANETDGRAVSELYRALQPQLARILASNLQAPDWVIEDACQTAWGALLERGAEVTAGGELGWLSTTATRAALRTLRCERRSQAGERAPAPVELASFRLTAPDQQLELRERLAEIRALPVRQRRVVLLQGFGYEYEEIAAVTGETRRTVTRQLTRARRRLATLAAG
jgi:RNA polymerase sigma factor (sigma-70 family)